MARQLAESLGAYPTGNLCNAHAAVIAMHARIKPLFPGARVAGPARTARITAGQNAAIHQAVHAAQPGEVLVVDGGASRAYGPFGDILASACLQRRIAGLVIDSTVRDSEEIEALGFPVFCLGRHPAATAKTEPGEVDITITCGGARVKPGDFVVGDADGVVVIPKRLAAAVAESVRAVAAREQSILAQIKAGQTTFEIFGLNKPR